MPKGLKPIIKIIKVQPPNLLQNTHREDEASSRKCHRQCRGALESMSQLLVINATPNTRDSDQTEDISAAKNGCQHSCQGLA